MCRIELILIEHWIQIFFNNWTLLKDYFYYFFHYCIVLNRGVDAYYEIALNLIWLKVAWKRTIYFSTQMFYSSTKLRKKFHIILNTCRFFFVEITRWFSCLKSSFSLAFVYLKFTKRKCLLERKVFGRKSNYDSFEDFP